MDPLGPIYRGKVPLKGEWVDASYYELPFIEETKKIIKNYSNISMLRVELANMGWNYQRFTSFLASIFRKRKFIFLTSKDSPEPGLKLVLIMGWGSLSHYYLLRWQEEYYDVYNDETEVR